MKLFKIFFISISILATGLLITSCGNDKKTEHSHEMEGKEYTSAYVCPMHCEGSGSDEAGTCPVCGMEYEKNTDHRADGHKHEEHKNHDH